MREGRRRTGLDPPRALTDAIHAETEGNPLFVAELARLLASEGALEVGARVPAIPPGIREVIGQRLRYVSDTCRKTLAPASVIGRQFLRRFPTLRRDHPHRP